MSIIFCDTNCELWYDRALELDLKVIQMPYTLDGAEYYYDLGEKTDFKAFYDRIRDKSVPKTSALNSENYREYFEPYFEAGEEILYISFSSEMSATFEYMNMAVKELSEKYPNAKFYRFDTKSISMGAGIQVYLAAKYFKEGHTIPEVITFLEDITTKVSVGFIVDDLHHLKRGGRLSSASAAFGSMLDLKPFLKIGNDGKLAVFEKHRGRRKALNTLADFVLNNIKDFNSPVIIINADSALDSTYVKTKILEKLPNLDIWEQPVGPVIGSHCGPDTIGVIFLSDRRA